MNQKFYNADKNNKSLVCHDGVHATHDTEIQATVYYMRQFYTFLTHGVGTFVS